MTQVNQKALESQNKDQKMEQKSNQTDKNPQILIIDGCEESQPLAPQFKSSQTEKQCKTKEKISNKNTNNDQPYIEVSELKVREQEDQEENKMQMLLPMKKQKIVMSQSVEDDAMLFNISEDVYRKTQHQYEHQEVHESKNIQSLSLKIEEQSKINIRVEESLNQNHPKQQQQQRHKLNQIDEAHSQPIRTSQQPHSILNSKDQNPITSNQQKSAEQQLSIDKCQSEDEVISKQVNFSEKELDQQKHNLSRERRQNPGIPVFPFPAQIKLPKCNVEVETVVRQNGFIKSPIRPVFQINNEKKYIEEPPSDYSKFQEDFMIKKAQNSFYDKNFLNEHPKDHEMSRTKIMTATLLDKITELQEKVRVLEENKLESSKVEPLGSQHRYGSIKKNFDSVKKLSSVTDTNETNSNNFRVRSFSNARGSSCMTNKIQSNLFSVMVLDGKEVSGLKRQIDFLKNRLRQLEENHFPGSNQEVFGLETDRSQHHNVSSNSDLQFLTHRSNSNMRGKIMKRKKDQENYQFQEQRVESQSSSQFQNLKGFVRSNMKKDSKFFKGAESQQLDLEEQGEKRNRIDSSALFQRRAMMQKYSDKILPKQLESNDPNTIQFNPENEKIIIESNQTSEVKQFKSSNQKKDDQNEDKDYEELDINMQIPHPKPTMSHSSQQLLKIGKMAFQNLNCEMPEGTFPNVKKYKNCVHFSLDERQNILWNFDGKFYFGGWKTFSNGEGEKSGEGVQIFPQKYKFKGYFIDGKRNGHGLMIMENGTYYDGQWQNGLRHGAGKQSDSQGFTYEGEWRQGKKCGLGKIFNKGVLQFEGIFEAGIKNGFGKQLFENGDSYEGNYVNNKFEGTGMYFWSSGAVYKGQFKNGMRNGEGEWHSGGEKEQDIYIGEYLNDKKNGFGKYRWANGSVYEGEFKKDLKHGKGKVTYEDGKVALLTWEKGEIVKKNQNEKKIKNSSSKLKLTQQNQTPMKRTTRSQQNLHSAKSTSTTGMPKGIGTKAISSKKLPKKKDTIKIKMFDEYRASGDLSHSQFKNLSHSSLRKRQGPQEPIYRGIQSSANINMNL